MTIKRASSPHYIFLYLFTASCMLFWWLPTLLFYLLPNPPSLLGPEQPDTLLISVLAWITFALGYILASDTRIVIVSTSETTLENVAVVSKLAAIVLGVSCLPIAVSFSIERMHSIYGQGNGLPPIYQVFFYSQLICFITYMASTNDKDTDPVVFWAITSLSVAIRLVVSLFWGRFFLAQAILPVILIISARKWFRGFMMLSAVGAVLAVAVVFGPTLTRGDFALLEAHTRSPILGLIVYGSTLKLFTMYRHLDLSGYCNPLFVSSTDYIIPFHYLHVCTMDVWRRNLPATLDRILARKEMGPVAAYWSLHGPGSNYILELYLCLGGTSSVLLGSFAFGIVESLFFGALGTRTMWGAVFCESLSRGLLAPRANIGYVFDFIPVETAVIVALWLGAALLAGRGPVAEHLSRQYLE